MAVNARTPEPYISETECPQQTDCDCSSKSSTTTPWEEGTLESTTNGTCVKTNYYDYSSDETCCSECVELPLKDGETLSLGPVRLGGQEANQSSYVDGWKPAGAGSVFPFLPRVNLFSLPDVNGRRVYSAPGTLAYDGSDVPQAELPLAASRNTTYFTTFHRETGVYFEYFAGSSLASGDARYGRVNRRYDTQGSQLSYNYTNNAQGRALLRSLSGDIGGNQVPYFYYADETIDSTRFAPLTKLHLLDKGASQASRTMYFEYANYVDGLGATYPFLSKVINPGGCVQLFDPIIPFADATDAYQLKRDVDPEGYQTYFTYNGTSLTRTTEPEGRIIYYEYLPTGETRQTRLGRPTRVVKYEQSTFGGHMPKTTQDTDALGNTTYWTYDATLARMTKKIEANGNLTYYDYVDSGAANQYALMRQVSAFNNATTYFGYNPSSYDLVKLVGPRHTSTFKVATYYTYDAFRNRTSMINALAEETQYRPDSLGRNIRIQDARGVDTYFNYSPTTGALDSKIDGAVNTTYFGYDSFQNQTAMVSPRWKETGSFQAFTTYYAYDALNRRTKTIDAQGNVTYFDYTSRGDVLDTVDAMGTGTVQTYNGLRLRTQATVTAKNGTLLTQTKDGYDIHKNRTRTQDGMGNPTYFFYDAIDRQTAQVDALQNRTYFYYDRVGNRTEITDARNNTTYYFYDLLSRQTAMRDALGHSTYHFYDLANNRTEQVDALGFATYFFYDALDRNQAMRDAVGNSTYYFYDPVGNQSVVVEARQSATYYFYDLLNRRKVTRDALNQRTYFGYDAAGNQTRILDARRNATYFFYDTLGRVSVQRNSLHEPAYFFYDGVGNRVKMTDARFNTTYYFFDGLRRETAIKDALAETTYFFYDLAGNRTVVVDARASATYFFYDPLNRTAAVRDPLANVTYYGYDAVSSQTRTRNARLNTTYFTYDRLNRQDGMIDPLGNAVLSRYDQVGNLTVLNRGVTGAVLGVTTYYFYDGARRRTAMVDGAGGGTYYFYDQTSNRTRFRNPLAHTTYFGYDRLNRVVQIQDAVAAKTYFAYDAVGNQIRVTDPLNHSLLTQYDALNRIYAFRYADTGSTYFFYDRVGNYVRTQDARANTTYFGYDAVNRLARLQDALGRTIYYEYDAVGNWSKFIDAESASILFTYDRVNRRTNLTYATGGVIVSDGLKSTPYYVYDAVGNITSMGDLWGGHLMEYDAADRLSHHQYPNGNFVYFRYDPRSNVIGRVYPGAAGMSGAAYDGLDRQTRVQSPSGLTAYFTYDAASNLTQRLLGNSAKLQATYDAAERAQNWRYTTSGGSPLTYFDYTRDAKGLITKTVREATHTVYYMYDPNDRLTVEIWRGATPETYAYRYAYDLAGNRTKATINGQNTYYEYDKANQLTRKGTNALFASATYYTYNRNGSLTDIAEASGTTKFAYNAAGLVARMRWKDASSTYFYYDAALQRYAINQNGTLNYFLWGGLDVLQELNANGTVKEEYTQAKVPIAGIGQLVEVNRPGQAQAKIYPVMDPRGTITKYVQSDGTTVFASREYDAFGQLIPNSSVGTWPGIFGYQGQAWQEILSADGAQRLLVSPTRLYDPMTGRFIQEDPLVHSRDQRKGFDGRYPFNLFEYIGSNPTIGVDPEGMQQAPDPNDLPDVEWWLHNSEVFANMIGGDVREGAPIKECKYESHTLSEGPYERKGDPLEEVAKKVLVTFKVDHPTKEESKKCCTVVQWVNARARFDGKTIFGTTVRYGYQRAFSDSLGTWIVDNPINQVTYKGTEWYPKKVEAEDYPGINIASRRQVFKLLKTAKEYVFDARFKTCIYNRSDVNEKLFIFTHSDMWNAPGEKEQQQARGGSFVLGYADIQAIICQRWTFRVRYTREEVVNVGGWEGGPPQWNPDVTPPGKPR